MWLRPSRSQRCCDRANPFTVLLVGRDLLLLLQRDGDVVEAVHQTMLDLGIDLEAELVDGLCIDVDARLPAPRELAALISRKLNRQHAVLRAVVAEDVRERRS